MPLIPGTAGQTAPWRDDYLNGTTMWNNLHPQSGPTNYGRMPSTATSAPAPKAAPAPSTSSSGSGGGGGGSGTTQTSAPSIPDIPAFQFPTAAAPTAAVPDMPALPTTQTQATSALSNLSIPPQDQSPNPTTLNVAADMGSTLRPMLSMRRYPAESPAMAGLRRAY